MAAAAAAAPMRTPSSRSLMRDELGNAFDVDERGRLPQAGAELNQQVGSARENAGVGIGLHESHGIGNGSGCFVADGGHEATSLQEPGSDGVLTVLSR